MVFFQTCFKETNHVNQPKQSIDLVRKVLFKLFDKSQYFEPYCETKQWYTMAPVRLMCRLL